MIGPAYARRMGDCCNTDYRKVFRTSMGFDDLKRFERHGLRSTQADLADMSESSLGPSTTLLEVGGGLGALHVELLERGAAAATTIDMSAGWDEAAGALLERRELTTRVTRLNGDFVADASSLPASEIVLLHRVICCYPDWEAMVDAAASRASRSVAFTVPMESIAARISLWVFHAWLRVQRCGFTSFIHPVDAMIERFAAHGFVVGEQRKRLGWISYRLDRTS